MDRVGDLQDTTSRPSEGGPPVRYFGLRASRSGIGLSQERSIRSVPRMLPHERALAREAYREIRDAGQKSRLAQRRICCKMSAPVP